jgi:hypothetical protein
MDHQHIIAFAPKRRSSAQLKHPRSTTPLQRAPLAAQSRYDGVEELEYSDYGRDPRLLPGWWILPEICLCVLLVIGVGLIA